MLISAKQHNSQVVSNRYTLLYFGNNNIGDSGLQYLAANQWPSLWKLQLSTIASYLYENNIGPQGIGFLVGVTWKQLSFLNLSQNNLGNKGCQNLSTLCAPMLRQLDLQLNQIGRTGFQRLLDSYFPLLHTINLSRCLMILASNKICFVAELRLAKKPWNKLCKINLKFNESNKKLNQFVKKLLPRTWGIKTVLGE